MRALDDLLAALPQSSDPQAGFEVDGEYLAGPAGQIRLLVGGFYLDIAMDDILSLLEGVSINDQVAKPVKAVLKHGTKLLGFGPADLFQPLSTAGRIPFAIKCRPPEQAHEFSVEKRRNSFHENERRFLARFEEPTESTAT